MKTNWNTSIYRLRLCVRIKKIALKLNCPKIVEIFVLFSICNLPGGKPRPKNCGKTFSMVCINRFSRNKRAEDISMVSLCAINCRQSICVCVFTSNESWLSLVYGSVRSKCEFNSCTWNWAFANCRFFTFPRNAIGKLVFNLIAKHCEPTYDCRQKESQFNTNVHIDSVTIWAWAW